MFMELLIALLIGVPLVLTIGLIAWAIIARNRIDELTRRVDGLESQIVWLKNSATAPTPAPAPPIIAKVAEPEPIPSPVSEPPQPAWAPPAFTPNFTPAIAPKPEPRLTAPPALRLPAHEPEPAKTAATVPPELAAPPFTPEVASSNESSANAPAATPPEKASFEMRLGTFWLVRIGIVMLLTGLAFFGNYAYHHIIGKLGPVGKTSLLYLASGLLLGAGAWWQRRSSKESLKNYAQVLFAGGLAAVYFTTYAAYHIPPLRIINSAVLDGTLLCLWAGVIAWIADWRKSEVMAMFAVGLAFYSSVITRVGDFTLYSNLVLTITAVVFLLRNRWANLSFAGLLTSYAGYAFWRFLHEDGWRWATPEEGLNFGAVFLAAYWLVFTVATFLSRNESLSGKNRAAFLTLNNSAFFALFLLTMIQVQSGGFWKFSLGYGTALLGLAALARSALPGEPLSKQAYLIQGLLLVTLGFISKFSGLQLSLVLGVESVLLYLVGTQRASLILQLFGGAVATLATGWCVASLKHDDVQGVWTGISLGGLMTFNAWWTHRRDTAPASAQLRAVPTGFTLLALACWLTTTWFNSTEANMPLMLAAEAVVLTLSIYLLRVREIPILGQSVLVLSQLSALYHISNTIPPWWNPLTVIVITALLSHWWQRQKTLIVNTTFSLACQTIFAVAIVALVLGWTHPLLHAPGWLALTALLAVVATIYGVVTRAWPLAVFGQIFLAASIWKFLKMIWTDKPEWYFPLVPITVLAMLSFAAVQWFKRKPDASESVQQPVLTVALVYRWSALALSLCWLWQYVPDHEHGWSFMLAAAAVFAFAVWKRNQEAFLGAAIYGLVSLGSLWFNETLEIDIYWANTLTLLSVLVMQQVLRRRPAELPFEENIQAGMIIVAGVSLWRLTSCWAATFTGGFYLTMTWAALALVWFTAGLILRERFHRWFGLGVLAASVGRVVLVDVWKQETIVRVITFMALGMALLIIGFIYNKYQDKIRLWL